MSFCIECYEKMLWNINAISYHYFLGRVRPPYMAISGQPRQKLDCLNDQAYDCLIHFDNPVQTVYTSQHSGWSQYNCTVIVQW